MEFLSDDILLNSNLAIKLYNNFAKDMPIIDYHCHINPNQILEDKQFSSITELWLSGDHYKWRLMRNCGVDEFYITGKSTDREKFKAFAKILPLCIGNPIYIWCHLELKKYFNITLPISDKTADEIYDKTAEMLKGSDFSVRNIIKKSNVKLICTTDDPTDNLETHKKLSNLNLPFKVLPATRPDKALNIELDGFLRYIEKLENISNIKIKDISGIKSALKDRLEFFIENGCRVSDHALSGFTFSACDEKEADSILKQALLGVQINEQDAEKFRTFILSYLAKLYAENNIIMQLHFNCQRNNNLKMFEKLGADTGFDSINSSEKPIKLVKFLSELEKFQKLPKTIIYSLDPNDDKLINTVINCFQGGMRGKLQHGAAWWFNDTENGMKEHFKTLAEYSVLGNFIGMLTDSRSFTSYIRHDYFRRILCSFIATQVIDGKYPNDENQLKNLIQNICYNNAREYLFNK